jgi:hypothetical protein
MSKKRAIRTWKNVNGQTVKREFCYVDSNKQTPKPAGTNRAEIRRREKLDILEGYSETDFGARY